MNRSAYLSTPGVRPLALSLSLAVALGSPVAFAAEEPTTEHYQPVRVEFDFRGEDPARTKRLQPALEEAARRTLTADYGVPIDDEAPHRLVFSVRWLDEPDQADRAVANYSAGIVLRQGDHALAEEIVPCMEMGEAELVRCALGGLTEVVPSIPRAEAAVADPPPDEPKPDTPPDYDPEDERAGEPPLTGFGGAGIALGVVGLAGIVGGAVYLARGDQPQSDPASGQLEFTNFRPTGGALVGIGSGLFAVGVTMLALDVVRQSRLRRSAVVNRRPAVSPVVGARFGGVAVRGRF